MIFKSSAQINSRINTFNSQDSIIVKDQYFTSLTDKLLIKLTSNYKYTTLEIVNTDIDKIAKLYPNGNFAFGMDVGYKWFGLGVAFGLPSSEEARSNKGNTTRFDIQLNLYSKKVSVDASLQRYKGFYIDNPDNFTDWDSPVFPQLPDMRNYFIGVSAYYIVNHKKFSYRAAYVRNEIQNKSAGSILVGSFFNFDEAFTGDQFIPSSLPSDAQESFPIDFFSSTSYGLAIGYTYSLVIKKKGFINLSLVPGVGIKDIKTRLNNVLVASKHGFTTRVTYKLALGYEHRSFLLGFTHSGNQGNIKINKFEFIPRTGNLKFFIAKRFDIKKKK
jgi:hypothetical protein